MKLLFINPPRITSVNKKAIQNGELAVADYTPFPSLGIGYLVAVAQNLGHKCKVLDLNVTPWKSEKEELDFSPDLILLSSLTLQYRAVKIIIDKFKGVVPIILGGPHASIFKEKLLKDGVDVVVVGEGENTLLSILENFPDSLKKVPGIVFKENNHLVDTGMARRVDNLDALAFPAWDYFDLTKYQNIYYGRKCLPVISSRGCPYQCVYCFKDVFGNKIRLRSAENIFQEIIFFKEKYNIGAIQFQDDVFNIDRERVEKFCQLLIDNKTDIIWRCLARADRLDYDLVELMKRAGCKSIAFGIESGNQKVLDRMGKKITLKQIAEAIKNCNRAGVTSKGYYIMGLPWDTVSTLDDTINFAKKNRTTQLQFTLPVAYPGTELWNIGKSKELPVEDYVESFCWDESLPPYSFSNNLTANQIEMYVLKARNLSKGSYLERFFKVVCNAKIKDYPGLFKKFCTKIRIMLGNKFIRAKGSY